MKLEVVVTIRPFEERDISSVVRLADELGLSHWSHNDYVEELSRQDSHMRVAVSADGLVGFIVGRRVPGSRIAGGFDAEIYNIGVDRKAQRKGVGDQLLSDFLDKCRLETVKDVWLEVRSNNVNAITFYKRAGFERFAIRRNFYADPPDSGIVMQLALDNRDS